MDKVNTISVEQLAELGQQGNLDVIDVRTPVEFGSLHATLARNFPLDAIDPDVVMKARAGDADQPLYLICKGGTRSAKAYQKFIDAGYTNVVSVEGGTDAWDSGIARCSRTEGDLT